MKKKIAILFLITGLATAMCSCGTQNIEESTDNDNQKETIETEVIDSTNVTDEVDVVEEVASKDETNIIDEMDLKDNISATDATDENKEKNSISFADLKDLQFVFSSGVGAWSTVFLIQEDGSFSGEYFDSDMGVIGEDYPNGTMYQSIFTGKFTKLQKVNEYTYSMQISELNYKRKAGTEEIKDGVKYVYSGANGLEKENTFFLYLPNAPIKELPEEFISWVSYYIFSNENSDKLGEALSFYGLYNKDQHVGFSSYRVEVDSLEETNTSIEEEISILEDTIENEEVIQLILSTEQEAVILEDSIKNAILTQLEYNEKTKQLYELWDFALNKIWGVLKETLEKEAMSQLTIEQKEWITFKEQEVEKAGAEYEGGSMQPMVMNEKAAEITKERVYELIKLLQ